MDISDINLSQAQKPRGTRLAVLLLIVLIVAFVALAGRCLYLQGLEKEEYLRICSRQLQAKLVRSPQRGVILDRTGRVLAASNQIQTIFVEPRILSDPKDTSCELGDVLDMPAHEICMAITESNNPGFVKIKADADEDECDAAGKIHGAGVLCDWQRHYPTGSLAAHVVGFTSADNRGLAGIELCFDKPLAGSPGQNIFLADTRRRPIRLFDQQSPLHDGVGIILTIDATIQQFAREELLEQCKNFRAESGVAIVAEPKTGAILAMVSLPDFEPDEFRTTSPDKFRNRAVTDQFEPGSILKPIAVAIALDAGAISTNETIFCENGTYAGKGFGRIGEYDYHKYGNLSIREVLVKSSNIGMAKIGQKLGKDKLYKGLRLFGFGKETGIELPGEAEGLLRPVKEWTGYSVTRIPFGQEISVTPIQLVRAFCMLANGGRPVRPFLVKAIVDNDGNIIKIKQPPPPVGFVIDPQIARWVVTDPMVGVVTDKQNGGTGWRANLENWQVFGKTGTANIAKSNERGYSDSEYISSFVAGAPAEDPAVIVLVSIRKPDRSLGKGYTGGAVASPVAAKIIQKTLTYLRVPPHKSQPPEPMFAKHTD